MEKTNKLSNYDLMKNKNKYEIDVLEKNINNLNHKILISNQILTADFCVKYLLNMDIESNDEDSYIFDKNYILEKQDHITEEEFRLSFMKYYNN
jgi:hypothetical protein